VNTPRTVPRRFPGFPADSAATSRHAESALSGVGHDVVANFGDQLSDLKGGHADRTFKMPNPNYFLP